MQMVEHQIEDLEQRDFAHWPPPSGGQGWPNVHFELLLRYTGRDSAHGQVLWRELLP